MKKIMAIAFLFSSINLLAMNFKDVMMLAAISLTTNSAPSVVTPKDSVKNEHAENDSKLKSQRRSKEFQLPQKQKDHVAKNFRGQGNDFRK